MFNYFFYFIEIYKKRKRPVLQNLKNRPLVNLVGI